MTYLEAEAALLVYIEHLDSELDYPVYDMLETALDALCRCLNHGFTGPSREEE